MKELKLVNTDRVALVDDEDYESVSKLKWRLNGEVVRKCRATCAGVRTPTLANFVMKDYTIFMFDHKDRDGLNNQKNNLRPCTSSNNAINRDKIDGCLSKYKGVSKHAKSGKWQPRVQKQGKRFYLGLFDNEVDAARAYNKKALELHGEFAVLNNDENGNPL